MGVLSHKKPRGLFMGEDPPTGVGTHRKPARAQTGSGAENPLVTMWWKWQGYEEIANKAYSMWIKIREGASTLQEWGGASKGLHMRIRLAGFVYLRGNYTPMCRKPSSHWGALRSHI